MSYLLINDINTISLSSIILDEKSKYYNIIYKKNDIVLNGVSFKCKGEVKKLSNGFFFKIKDINIIKLLRNIDEYLNIKLKNYINLLKYKFDEYGIYFNINNITINKLKDNPIELYLNLKYINKGYNNIPIIHLI